MVDRRVPGPVRAMPTLWVNVRLGQQMMTVKAPTREWVRASEVPDADERPEDWIPRLESRDFWWAWSPIEWLVAVQAARLRVTTDRRLDKRTPLEVLHVARLPDRKPVTPPDTEPTPRP